MPRYRFDDEDVVVIVGSGAGGGTLANELCQQGVKVVVLEAGRHHTPDDFVNDEWRSFKQLAWLDKRTTSGSFRIAQDFPNLPAWTCKTVGGTTVHWAGCCPRFMEHEFKASTYYDGLDGVNALDWPISLRRRRALLRPRRGEARAAPGRTASRSCRPTTTTRCSPTARSASATSASTPAATRQPGRRATAGPATIQDGFNFQGVKDALEVVDARPSSCRAPRRPASSTCAPRRTSPGSSTTTRGSSPASPTSTATGSSSSSARGSSRWPATRSRPPRLLLNSESAPVPRRARELLRPGRAQLHAPPHRVGVRDLRQAGAHVPRRDDGRAHRGRGAQRPGRGFVGGYYMQLLALGVPFMAAFMDPGGWGRDFTSALERLREHGRHVARRRGHAAGDQPRHAQPRRARPVRPAGAGRALRRPRRTTSRCASTRGRPARRCTSRSARSARSAPRRTRRRTTSARRA